MNSGGALPTGLSALTDYFVRDYTAGTFKLALTSGGTAVDITGVGTGTHYISADLTSFETLRSAMKLVVGHWYMQREAVVAGTQSVLPMAVDALVSAQLA